MGVESIFNKWIVKDGTVSLPIALQASSFFLFADLCIYWANLRPFSPWISSAANVPPLLGAFVFILALYSLLNSAILPFILIFLVEFEPIFMPKKSQTDYGAHESVLDFKYERFALETNNGVALAFVNNHKEERKRYYRNGGLFLMWIWLTWAEVSFCLPASGTIGNKILPLPFSGLIVEIGCLICVAITILWIAVSARNHSSSKIPVSQKLRLEIEEREKGPTQAVMKNSNQGNVMISPLTFPSGSMLEVRGNMRQREPLLKGPH